MGPTRIIGLTGGIATGKSTVAHYLATTYGVPVLDADVYAREAVAPGSPILAAIAQRYGQEILKPDATLDRQKLASIIFNDPAEREWLESRIHPYVRDRLQKACQALSQQPIIVMVIPLLFEAQMTDLVTETWVVFCSLEQQLQQLMGRDRLTLEQAHARIVSQMPLAEKVAQATIVLNNSSTLEALQEQVDAALESIQVS